MLRGRAGILMVVAGSALACGARTGLPLDEDLRPGSGGNGARIPVSTNCQLQGDDPRVAGIRPDEIASLDGARFVSGDVSFYHWSVQREDCDAVVQNAQFRLDGVDSQIVKFQPSRPAFYHFTLEVVGLGGDTASCKLEVPVQGAGMRVELCWDTSTSTDLDLYLHTPFDTEPWFARNAVDVESGLNGTTCNTSNAVANLRQPPRVDWGYPDSTLSTCNTPAFDAFLGIGRCPNPRAADDNNQMIATGTTERMQLDNPSPGQRFRVMVQNFSNTPATPHVFVYCGGERAGAFDAPASPPGFRSGPANGVGFGVMWRAADITTNRDAAGNVTCSTAPVPGAALTVNDSSF